MMMFRGSPRYGGLWFVYCIRKKVSDAIGLINVIGTWSHIEEPSAIIARVEPALEFGRGFVCDDCLAIASDWVCNNKNEGRKQER